MIEYRLAQYMKRVKELKDPTGTGEWKRFKDTLALFEKYGSKYGFDPLMLAAQGYQESTLDQNAKSHVGAIGVMQIMPATGAAAEGRRHPPDRAQHPRRRQVHGPADGQVLPRRQVQRRQPRRYSRSRATTAGPGNIAKMRNEAAKRGLDPDKWFNNVEIVTAEKIGIETTTYVRNIYKYYVAYKLMLDAHEARDRARQRLAAQKG